MTRRHLRKDLIRRRFVMKGTMIKFTPLKPIALISAAILLLTGCTVRETHYDAGGTVSDEVVVDGPPPAPLVDEVTISPGPDFLWIPGVWVWNGRWVWEHGHWGHRPHPGAVWVPHRYAYRNGRHVFIRGHWG